MSSTVLARKYRPRSFESLVGQPHVVQALGNALNQQRLHHAYLFTGTRGVGKTTISRILAKSLNCTGADGSGGITATPCGTCQACRDIDAGRFIDYVELDAASNRGVEEITRLLDQAVYKPVIGRFKVYLIDEVHMLSSHAFNAMLKTLEEPPDYLKFILATTDPQKVPPTVLSRCLQFNLRPMAPQTIVDHLGTVLAAEGVPSEVQALKLIARAARGSMRDAESLADQAIAYGDGRIDEAPVRQMLGAVDRGHAVRIVEAAAAQDGAALVAAAAALRELGLSAAGALEEIAALLQQMAVVQAVPEAADTDDPDGAGVARLAGLLPADETQLLYSLALHGRAELALAPDEYSGLTMVLLRMLAFPPRGESAGTRAPVPAASSAAPAPRSESKAAAVAQPQAGPAAPASPMRVAAAAVDAIGPVDEALHGAFDAPRADAFEIAPPVAVLACEPEARPVLRAPGGAGVAALLPSGSDRAVPAAAGMATAGMAAAGMAAAGDRWMALVQSLVAGNAIAAMVRELAMQADCLAVVDGEGEQLWRLRVERENLRAPSLRERLQAAIATTRGRPVRLEVEPGPARDSPALREAAERAGRQAEAERIIHDDPLVKALMSQYKTARIVPGSVKPH